MTILWLGGETGSLDPSTSLVIENTASHHNSSFCRAAIFCRSSSDYANTPVWTAQTEIWLHFEVQGNFSGSASGVILELRNASTAYVRLTHHSSTQELILQYWNGSAWTTVGSITLDLNGLLQTIDLHAVVNTATGTLELYVAGTQRIVNAALDLSGIASITNARFYGTTGGVPRNYYFSQLIAASEVTVGMRLGTVYMSGNGASTTWNGSYIDIDETVYSDADTINSTSNNEVELYTGTAVFNSTGYRLRAVAVTARAKKSTSGPTQMALALRSSSTIYLSTTHSFASVGYEAHTNVWETNPATTAAFHSSELSALQFGVKSLSSTST